MDNHLNYHNNYGLTEWTRPYCYGGFNPVGDFIAAVKTRDSGLIDTVNWDVITEALQELNEKFVAPQNPYLESGDENYFYTFVARHWACGWVEYAMIRRDAPEEYHILQNDFESALANYPLLDDERHSQTEWDAMYDIWEHASIRDRIEYCAQAGVSIFSARHDDIVPEGVEEIIRGEVA